MAILSGVHFLSLVGQQGAGKSFIGKEIAFQFDCPHVEASDMVKMVAGDLARADMHKTNERTKSHPDWLGNAIAHRVLEYTDASYVVLTGVREKEVHDTLHKLGATLYIINLEAAMDTRYLRHLHVKCETLDEFIQDGQSEMKIGLQAVIDSAAWMYDTTTSPSVTYSVHDIRQHLGY